MTFQATSLLPIRVRQFPRFVQETARRERVLRRPRRDCVFHLCFFTCRSYFRYLYCSLHSLVRMGGNVRLKVLVFSDEEQPLSPAQVEAVRALVPSAQVIVWPKSMGWGATQIDCIWRAYALAAAQAADDDMIVRVDSDVFFFNDRIFRAAARSDADLIGDGHYVGHRYCQGGCYFFRDAAVRRIGAMLEQEPVDAILGRARINVEDIAAHHFAQRLGMRIWTPWFMMFPDELRNAGGLTPWQRWKFSCVHFVMKNKAAMLDAYDAEVLQGADATNYHSVLATP